MWGFKRVDILKTLQWPTPSHVYFLSVGLQAGVLLKEFVLLINSSLITNKKEAIELNI